MIKRWFIQDLRKVKKGVIEFKIGQQSKKGGHRGNGSLKMGAIDRHMLRVHHGSAPPPPPDLWVRGWGILSILINCGKFELLQKRKKKKVWFSAQDVSIF